MKVPIYLAILFFVLAVQASKPTIHIKAKKISEKELMEQVAEKLKPLEEAQNKQDGFEQFAKSYMEHMEVPVFAFDLMPDEVKNSYTKQALELLRQQGTDVVVEANWEFIITQDDAIHYFPVKTKESNDTRYIFTLITGEQRYFAKANIKQRAKFKKRVIFRPTIEGCCVIL